MQLLQLADAQRLYALTGAQDRVAQRVIAPHGCIVQLEHEIIGRILHHADLLEDHVALECEIR